ncbi:MAG: nucleotidyl transferase AbiEii/AbiGii toxin family protein [Burkholderiales bacterium]
MADERLRVWEKLFGHALSILDESVAAGAQEGGWSFGGGTVLMRRYRHRVSRDVDIFVPDPQWLGYLTPRLNARAESLAPDYVEQAGFVKLYFAEGEIDFVVSSPLTADPASTENLFGRNVRVETSAEIIAKKVWHRGAEFTARDLFDLTLVAHREPDAMARITSILAVRRNVLMDRLAARDAVLREDFDALDVLDFSPSYDECIATVRRLLDAG